MMKEEQKKTIYKVIAVSIGFFVLLAGYFFIFSDDTQDAQKKSNRIGRDKKTSWKAFNMNLPKEEGIDITQNRGALIDEGLKEEKLQKEREQRKKQEMDRKGQVRLENTDLSGLLKDFTTPKNEEHTNSNTASQPQKKIVEQHKTVRKSKPPKNKKTIEKPPSLPRKKRTRSRTLASSPGWTKKEVKGVKGVKEVKTSTKQLEAIIHEEQEIRVNDRSKLTIRFLHSNQINNCEVQENKLYTASIVGVSQDRLLLQISIMCAGKRYTFEAYDEDGERGIFISELSQDSQLGKSIVGDVVGNQAQRLGAGLGIPILSNSIGKVLSTQKEKQHNITISAGKKFTFSRS